MATKNDKCLKVSKYWEKVKDSQTYQVNQLKSPFFRQKSYWRDVLMDMERLAMQEAKATQIKDYDLSTALPAKLYKRVGKIIPLIPIEEDRFEDDIADEIKKDEMTVDQKEPKMFQLFEEYFNGSTCSEIEKQQEEFMFFDVEAEKRNLKKPTQMRNVNWQAEFICKKRKERVKWPSKIYKLEKSIWEKPLYEQAEQLMDTAAERFTQWVNALGSNKETDISKDVLKSLFSLESGEKILQGINIEPKQIRAVPNDVALKWNVPEMSLELKLDKKMNDQKTRIPSKVPTFAFGLSLPEELRPWKPIDAQTIIEPVFPLELRTREVLFKGIGHLRSTRALVDYYKNHEKVERPQYLIDSGCFAEVSEKKNNIEIPLYELLNLKA